jgi:endonuclease III
MNKKQQLTAITQILKTKFPNPQCALIHKNPWELLVATILSAQCTDKRVNMVTPQLFAKLPDPESMRQAPIEEIEELVKSTGFYKNKAKNLKACAEKVVIDYNNKLPQTLEELVKLPGVGRKTASVLLGTAFNKSEGIVVDTHVSRLSQRMGFTLESDAVKIEKDLMKLVPKSERIIFSHLLILHGRERCSARKPMCEVCELNEICPKLPYKKP